VGRVFWLLGPVGLPGPPTYIMQWDWGDFGDYLHLLLSIIIFIAYVKFINCVDPFHEVKSKREKKKEVRAFIFLKYVMSFSFQITLCAVMFVLVLLELSIFDLTYAQLACFFIH
jgi:hypothetical protein